jgi:hypothetical protein
MARLLLSPLLLALYATAVCASDDFGAATEA